MKIYENTTIRVFLTDEQSEQWGHCRADILSHAMSVLGNRSEAALISAEPITPPEIMDRAIEDLTVNYLVDHCRYNANEVIMRMTTGRGVSGGMQRDVETARAYATSELRENPSPHLSAARNALKRLLGEEQKYRNSRARSDWRIDIIGIMPTQIGMCRYREVLT
jgi:hypothetical protein